MLVTMEGTETLSDAESKDMADYLFLALALNWNMYLHEPHKGEKWVAFADALYEQEIWRDLQSKGRLQGDSCRKKYDRLMAAYDNQHQNTSGG